MIKLNRDVVIEKMERFCAELLELDDFQALNGMIERFTADPAAQAQYQQFMDQYDAYQKTIDENEADEAETAQIEEAEMRLYENEVIREYLFAKREFDTIHDLISQYYTKTVALNRLPAAREIKVEECGCGGVGSGR